MNNMLIGQHLLGAGKISAEDIERASHLQGSVGGRFGSALIKLGAISEDHLLESLSEQLDLPIEGWGEVQCPHTGCIYRLNKGQVTKCNS